MCNGNDYIAIVMVMVFLLHCQKVCNGNGNVYEEIVM